MDRFDLKTIQSTGKATKLTVKNLNNIQLIHLAELFFFFFLITFNDIAVCLKLEFSV